MLYFFTVFFGTDSMISCKVVSNLKLICIPTFQGNTERNLFLSSDYYVVYPLMLRDT